MSLFSRIVGGGTRLLAASSAERLSVVSIRRTLSDHQACSPLRHISRTWTRGLSDEYSGYRDGDRNEGPREYWATSPELRRMQKENRELRQMIEDGELDLADVPPTRRFPDHYRVIDRRPMREYVTDLLYNPEHGYFSTMERHFTPPVTDFRLFRNDVDYRVHLARLFASGLHWVSPADLLAPYYSHAFARYVVSKYTEDVEKLQNSHSSVDGERGLVAPLKVYELSSASNTGVFALHFLNYIRDRHPELYQSLEYVVIEPRSVVREWVAETLTDHEQRVTMDPTFPLQWTQQVNDSCFVIGIETLCRLGHDKLFKHHQAHGVIPYHQINISTYLDDHTGHRRVAEEHTPLEDPLIELYLQVSSPWTEQEEQITGDKTLRTRDLPEVAWTAVEPYLPSTDIEVYVPTGALYLFEILDRYFPNSRTIFADYDTLQTPVKGLGAPIVQKTEGGCTYEYQSFTAPRFGTVDIIFPVDFNTINRMYSRVTGKRGEHFASEEFFEEYGELEMTETRSGFNPLQHDFNNMTVFLSK